MWWCSRWRSANRWQVPAGEALRGRRVLVIEDEMLVAMEFESLLQRQGCAVVGPASTVDRALALLDHDQPDTALLDLNLIGEPASAVAVAMRTRGVPFVLVTGYGKAQSSEPELQGAPRVDKPVNHYALVRALAQVMDAGSPS